jgi:hypothetical protein
MTALSSGRVAAPVVHASGSASARPDEPEVHGTQGEAADSRG